MFIFLMLKYKEHAEKFISLLDEFHEDPEILNVHPEEKIIGIIDHLVKNSDLEERLKNVQLINEKIDDQYQMVNKWWNTLNKFNGFEVPIKNFINWLSMMKIAKDIREADDLMRLIGEQSTLSLTYIKKIHFE